MSGHMRIGKGLALITCLLATFWVANVQAGAYMGFSLGQSLLDDTAKGTTVEVDIDQANLGWKIFGGGFKKYWGVEGAWVSLGDVQDRNSADTKAFIESEGFALQALGIYPFFDGKFLPYVKLGVILWDQDLRFDGGPGTSTILGRNDDGTDGAYGVGLWWRPNTFFGMRLEWERFDMESEVDLISWSMVLHFN